VFKKLGKTMKNYIQFIVKNITLKKVLALTVGTLLRNIQAPFKSIIKNITLFKILALTIALTLYYYIINTLLWTLSVLKFRLISITGSYYYFNILGALKGRIIPIWERLVK
jgi:hypothetical protein